ncbi:OmpA/MotB family protein [Anaeromyxobacter oryzae]|uniref:Chemotaxis protein MotB n=1 Tax=Anaeromyxobacter oryzae TaxID=2918170 RepID=A0ABM7X386_9BACT|nr:OmpA family protein [Anaeromyxobacter oryzae]BDG06259.1 chemotaxis protein MotB [Anaeromyxobacter oryzae]
MPRLAVAALALVALAGCVSQDAFRKKEAEAEQLRKDWREEQVRRAKLQESFDQLKAQLDAMLLDVNSLREKIRADEATLAQKEAELRAAQGQTADLQALVDELSKSKKKLEAAKAELERKSAEYEQLASALRTEIDAGRIELTELRGRTTVKMKDKILFGSGSATIGKDGREALRAVADALRNVRGKTIRVEGHTDNVPTSGTTFPSNWDLSSARAIAVVRFLQEAGVDPTRVAAAGYGEWQPVAANDTPEGRSLNRRIEIILVPVEGAAPAVAAPPAQAAVKVPAAKQ